MPDLTTIRCLLRGVDSLHAWRDLPSNRIGDCGGTNTLARAIGCTAPEHHSIEPKRSIDREPPQRQAGIVSPTHSANVDRGIEQGSSHLAIQFPENVFDFAAAPEETLVGLEREPIAFVFGDGQVERPFDSLSLGLCSQSLLSAFNFYRIQLKVFVRAPACRGHRSAPPAQQHSL